MTGTVIKAWSDRALDVYRANLSENRPPVAEAGARGRLLVTCRLSQSGPRHRTQLRRGMRWGGTMSIG